MIKHLIRKISETSPFANEWGLQAGNKKVIVGYNVLKETMSMTINITRAKFSMKDSYFSVKQRGYSTVEFTPFIENPHDPYRKTYAYKEKRSIAMFPDTIFEILNNKPVNLEYRREREHEVYRLTVKEIAPNWEWALEIIGHTNEVRKVIVKPSEQFYIKKMLEFSVPYLFGWYALGDSRLAEQSLVAEVEPRDPFENI